MPIIPEDLTYSTPFSWGYKDMLVIVGSYVLHLPSLSIEEIDIIPGPDIANPSTAIQVGGRSRSKVSMRVVAADIMEYGEYYADYLTNSVKDLILRDMGYFGKAMILGIGPTTDKEFWLEFDIVFLEIDGREAEPQ